MAVMELHIKCEYEEKHSRFPNDLADRIPLLKNSVKRQASQHAETPTNLGYSGPKKGVRSQAITLIAAPSLLYLRGSLKGSLDLNWTNMAQEDRQPLHQAGQVQL